MSSRPYKELPIFFPQPAPVDTIPVEELGGPSGQLNEQKSIDLGNIIAEEGFYDDKENNGIRKRYNVDGYLTELSLFNNGELDSINTKYIWNTNTLTYYDGSSWASYIGDGDITGVTITTGSTSGLSGGATATSGAFSSTLLVAPTQATSATVASGAVILIADIDDSNNLKKTTAGDIAGLAGGVSLGLVIALS